MKNTLKYLIFGGLLLTPFIVFLVPQSMFFPFVVGKGFAFRILVEILFGLFVVLAFLDKEYRSKFSWLTKSILLFTFVILVADLLGENPYKSIWSNYERMEGFMFVLHLAMFYLVASTVINKKEKWGQLFSTSIFASVLMSFYGMFQLAGKISISQGGVRLDGTLGNSTYLAIYLVFHIFLCLYFLVNSKAKWQKWVYGSVALMEIWLLYFTATRGAILGLIGGLLLTALLLIWRSKTEEGCLIGDQSKRLENRILRKISIWLLGVVAVVIIGFLFVRDADFVKSSPVLSRFSTLSVTEFRTQGRYYVWPMAIKGIAERPLLGWGQESFNFVFNKYYDPGLFGQEEWFDRTHNTFLDWMIAGGVIGFLAYISIYVALFYLIWRRKSPFSLAEKSVLTGMISAYIFHNIFVFDNLVSYIIFFSVLAFVHSISVKDEIGTSAFYTKVYSRDVVNYVVLPVAVLITAGMIYFVNVPALQANFTLIQALSNQGNDPEKNLELFKKVFAYNSYGSAEAVEHLAQTTTRLASLSVSDEIKQNYYNFTREKLEERVAKNPNDARYLVFTGSFFNKFGQYDEAIKYLERALVESPNKQSIHFELGTSYLGKGDKQKMLELFRIAYELKPSATESQVIYLIGGIYAKNQEVQDEVLKAISKNIWISDDRIVKAYSEVGDYDNVFIILNARLEKNPTDLQTKFTLAEAYVRVGQKQKAISLIGEMIAQDPTFKEQGEAVIKQILSM